MIVLANLWITGSCYPRPTEDERQKPMRFAHGSARSILFWNGIVAVLREVSRRFWIGGFSAGSVRRGGSGGVVCARDAEGFQRICKGQAEGISTGGGRAAERTLYGRLPLHCLFHFSHALVHHLFEFRLKLLHFCIHKDGKVFLVPSADADWHKPSEHRSVSLHSHSNLSR